MLKLAVEFICTLSTWSEGIEGFTAASVSSFFESNIEGRYSFVIFSRSLNVILRMLFGYGQELQCGDWRIMCNNQRLAFFRIRLGIEVVRASKYCHK